MSLPERPRNPEPPAKPARKRIRGGHHMIAHTRHYTNHRTYILKGTVQPELRGVKIGINRTAMKICVAGKCRLSCPKGHHHERSINILGGCSTF